ncbi:MAG: primosomal protein N' [Spirochaetia bacterium]|nr:primosomal protein N' [Spirochaetia bacterium]MBQ3648327.1 primosomal protein N' [Spirochaetia bacterium]
MADEKKSVYIKVAFNLPLKKVFTYLPAENMECAVGMRVKAPFGRREIQGFVVDVAETLDEDVSNLKAITKIMETEPLFGPDTWQTALWIADMYMCGWGEALYAMLPGGKREKDLEDELDGAYGLPGSITLTDEQQNAVASVLAGSDSLFYIHGITGSGKTEVFLTLADKMLAEGKGIIYLVPEIALTHQMVDAVKKRFADTVAVLHSALTPAQRLKQWRRIQSGEAKVVIGARSGIFAPVQNLGLIIIDEEHENSYKSGSSPRYHARQVAMYRARKENAKLVMGSATPSVEAYYLMEQGTIARLPLTKRVSGGKLPQIQVVDMSREHYAVSDVLRKEIIRVCGEGKQVILFLNRRGFFYNFSCMDCGFEAKCSHCSIPLTYHKDRGLLICHYCGYSQRPERACPQCGSLQVGYSGFGTEKIEDDIQRLFPHLKTLRLDSDTASDKRKTKEVLDSFAKGQADILLGTQMVAKGFNFPKVSLVGIILADTTLQMPDFRSAERTFALLTQVSGRSGRYSSDGKVIIQTYRPDNYAIACAAALDEKKYYAKELASRKMLGFPPFSRLFRFVFRSKDQQKASSAAADFAQMLLQMQPSGYRFQMLGPAECPLAVISDNYRYQIIINTDKFAKAHGILSAALAAFKAPSGVYVEADVDPASLM